MPSTATSSSTRAFRSSRARRRIMEYWCCSASIRACSCRASFPVISSADMADRRAQRVELLAVEQPQAAHDGGQAVVQRQANQAVGRDHDHRRHQGFNGWNGSGQARSRASNPACRDRRRAPGVGCRKHMQALAQRPAGLLPSAADSKDGPFVHIAPATRIVTLAQRASEDFPCWRGGLTCGTSLPELTTAPAGSAACAGGRSRAGRRGGATRRPPRSSRRSLGRPGRCTAGGGLP